MNPIKLLVHATGTGICALTGNETDGLTVTFDDGTVREQHLSWKAFRQLLSMKAGSKNEPPPPRATIGEPANHSK